MPSVKDIDHAFEAELSRFTPQTADRITFNLGNPSKKLLSVGIQDKRIKLHGSKLLKKIRKHGFSTTELRGLTRALRNPMAIFQTNGRQTSYAVLTTLRTTNGNFLVALDLGKGADSDLLVVSSVYGKGDANVVSWINGGKLRFVDKKKALNYLHLVAPIATASDNDGLNSAANIVRNFQNTNFSPTNSQNLARDLRKVLGSSK